MNNLEGRGGRLHNEITQDSNGLCFNRYGYFQGWFVVVLCPQLFVLSTQKTSGVA